jgi:hypothetical protein
VKKTATRLVMTLAVIATIAVVFLFAFLTPRKLTASVLSLPEEWTLDGMSILNPDFQSVEVEDAAQLEQVQKAVSQISVRFCGWAKAMESDPDLYTVFLSVAGDDTAPSFSVRRDGVIFSGGKKYRVQSDSTHALVHLLPNLF